jgi:16S rRNA processing protein RimM
VAVGRIGKPHGVRGWVTVMPTTDEPEIRFAEGATVLIDDLPRTVIESRVGSRLMVLFDACRDREDAEALRGRWIEVVLGDEVTDDPDEFYDHQLEGLQVRVAGEARGTVTEVLHLPGHDVLAVETPRGQVLIPFVADVVPEVDLGAGYVEVVELEGLFDAD